MKKFLHFFKEVNDDGYLSDAELKAVERYADKLFAALGIDIEFSRHFKDRANDPRNGKPITPVELAVLFRKEFDKYGKVIQKLPDGAEAVLKDMKSDINTPFVFDIDKKGNIDLILKTVMRKKNFKTRNKQYVVK